MPFKRDSLTTIRERIISTLEQAEGMQPRLRHTVENALANATAAGNHALYGYIEFLSKQLHPYTATETDWIDYHAGQWLDQGRKAASLAKGSASFTGIDGSIIAAATILQRADGVQFTVDSNVTIVGGVATAQLTAIIAGVASNTDALSILSLVSPILNIDSNATTSGISNGFDAESNERLKDRYLARIKEPPHGGSENDYITWALEVAGVTRAWVYPAEMSLGTVTVRFVVDDHAVSIIPDSAKVAEVLAHIQTLRPVTAIPLVAAPIPIAINPTISLNPSSASIRTAVEAELQDMILREAIPAGSIYLSHINEAISIAAGEVDHGVVLPVADVTRQKGEIAVLGTITWQ